MVTILGEMMNTKDASNQDQARIDLSENKIEHLHDHMEDLQKAQQTLMTRPHFSVRKQIYLGNIVIFIFAALFGTIMMINTEQVQHGLTFLEFVNDFSSEILQARRYEKNYFLYGTNLNDAIDNIHLAKLLFIREGDSFSKLQNQKRRETMLSRITSYESLLNELQKREQNEGVADLHSSPFSKRIESQLRSFGQEILAESKTLMKQEKSAIEKTLIRSRNLHIYAIFIFLIILVIKSWFLIGRIYKTLKRFSIYAQRIASGDFRPVLPKRKYRDEFTDLAIAVNEMIREIDAREAALVQSHKMRAVGTLTAGVAHELNNPLNNIMLTVHMLIEDYHDLSEDECIDMLNEVAAETDRAKTIIRSLLDFARESSATMELVNLVTLINDTVQLLENQIRLSGITVDVQLQETLPKIQGDGQKLQQVFVNLLLNAMDASSKGSKIQVMGTTSEKGKTVKITFIDYGEGIPQHILSSVFDPFFTTKPKGKGTGLGLSVSQGIIAKHGGNISVESQEGSGSSFVVSLPVITFPELGSFKI